MPEQSNSIFSTEELTYLKKLSLHDRSQLLFSILYLGSRQVTEDDVQPLLENQGKNPVNLETLVKEVNTELNSRAAPYVVSWHKEQKYMELVLKQEVTNELSFSEHFFKIENLSRDKYKVLSFITFKLYLEHSHCSVEDLLTMEKTWGFDELKLAKILYDLEQENLIYQVKRGSANDIQLTNQFFEVMSLPMDRFQLGPILRNELIKVLQGDSLEDEDEADIIEDESDIEQETQTSEEEESDATTEENEKETTSTEKSEDDEINDLLKSLDKKE